MVSGLFNIPNPQKTRRRKIAPSDPSLNQPSRQSLAACPERPNSSRTFTDLNNSLNHESKEWQNNWIDISSSIGILYQNFAENNEMYRAESEFSKRETRNRLPGADIATDQTKTFITDNSPRKSSEAATEEVFTIRSITIQTKRPNSSSASREAKTEQNIH